MNTIILFWRPSISSFKIDDFQYFIENRDSEYFNWSVWEYDKAHCGDRFFMVRCGEGKTGICMSGKFISSPYKDTDWSGQGRDVYYMDMYVDTAIHPDFMPILTTERLQAAIPDFDWTGGHSGRLIAASDAAKLEKMWKEFLNENDEIFHYHAFRD